MGTRTASLRKRIVGYLGEDYDPADDELIALYCDLDEQLQRVKKELKGAKLMGEHTNKAGATNIAKHPLLSEVPKLVQQMNAVWKSFGLTAAQRKKAGSAPSDPDDDFEV